MGVVLMLAAIPVALTGTVYTLAGLTVFSLVLLVVRLSCHSFGRLSFFLPRKLWYGTANALVAGW